MNDPHPHDPHDTPNDPSASQRRIAVSYVGDAQRTRATDLARELGLLCVDDCCDPTCAAILAVTPERLELRATGRGAPGPVFVDFDAGATAYRRKHGGGRNEPIARAVGLKRSTPTVIDATAGLGRDAFLLAALGCQVTMIERSPILAALLRDGMDRALSSPQLREIVGNRMTLHVGDSVELLPTLHADVVYLDPMFPPRRRESALVKKQMRLVRLVVGDEDDSRSLFEAAREASPRRIVVKRPRHAPPVAGEPALVVKSPTMRYDVYFPAPGDVPV
ncbi:MAG: class I SAM-dependent methyltransferase [Phycisphaerales bacterium]|nr:class I SAM-dependent methyltransferase [Phycisphaerales bacterium]